MSARRVLAGSRLADPASVGWALIGQLAATIPMFVASVLISRGVPVEEFGVFTLASTMMTAFAVLADVAVQQAIIIASEEHSRLFRTWELFAAVVALATVAVQTVVMAIVFADREEGKYLAWIYGAALFFLNMNGPPRGLMIRKGMNRALAVIDGVSGVLGMLVGLAVADLRHDAIPLAVLVGATATFRYLPTRVCASRYLPSKAKSKVSLCSALASLQAQVRGTYAFQLSTYATRNFDNFVIRYGLGFTALGLYGRAFTLFLGPLVQLQAAIGPVAMRDIRSSRDAVERMHVYWKLMFLATLPPASIFVFFSEPLVASIFGPRWSGLAPLLRLAAPIVCTLSFGLPAHWFLQAQRVHWAVRTSAAATLLPLVGITVGVAMGSLEYAIAGYALCAPITAFCQWGLAVRVDTSVRACSHRIARQAGSAVIVAGLVGSTASTLLSPAVGLMVCLAVVGTCAMLEFSFFKASPRRQR